MKRITALVLGCLLIIGMLCGCETQPVESKSSNLPLITIGSDTYPPYIYMNTDGTPVGIDVEIATEAFSRMGYQAEFVTIEWEQKKTLVESGEIDCIWGCFSMYGREKDYQWAGPYMVSRQVVAVNAKSDIYSLADLAGKTVAVQVTSKPEELFLENENPNIPQIENLLSIEERSIQYAALDCGYVDAVAAHETAILQYMEDYDADFRILDEPLLTTGIGVAFSKNDTRGIAEELTKVLDQMRKDGTMEKIIGKYLENPEIYLEVESLED